MQEINYEWEVLEHQPGADSMVVKFTPVDATDIGSMIVAMPFPPEGVDAEGHIEGYAPLFMWIEQRTKRTRVNPGFKGRKGLRGGEPMPSQPVPDQPIEQAPPASPHEIPDMVIKPFKV